LPNVLLLADPRVIGVLDYGSIQQKHMFAYDDRDFEQIITHNEKLGYWLHSIWQIVRDKAPRDEVLEALSKVPEIADILSPECQSQQTLP
jgi:hypothetical protein